MPRNRTRSRNDSPAHTVEESSFCELCMREAQRYTVHHLVPRAEGGKFGPTARLCATCHRQLHAMFTESTLARELNSLASIQSHSEMRKYLKWVRKQKHGVSFKVRRANGRR